MKRIYVNVTNDTQTHDGITDSDALAWLDKIIAAKPKEPLTEQQPQGNGLWGKVKSTWKRP